jgi:prolyl oligopeptidase
MKTLWFTTVLVMPVVALMSSRAHADTKASATPASTKPAPAAANTATDDPYTWLEEVEGAKALEWVKAKNAVTLKDAGSGPAFEKRQAEILEVLDSDARIPYVNRMGKELYNFWKDKNHPKGLWRRTTLEEYRKPQPNWETVIDLDALAASEKENWVWQGIDCLKPEFRHCIVYLSRGGADASVIREYDLKTKSFVKDGFTIPEAKSQTSWIDANTLFVGTDFGPGSMTKSGYARLAKLWKRGTPLASATLVYEGKMDDVSVNAGHDNTPGFERDIVSRGIDTYHNEVYLRGKDGKLTLIEAPTDANVDPERDWLFIQTRSPWTVGGKTFPAGALLAEKFDDFMAGKRDLTVLFTPTATTSLSSYNLTKHHLILGLLDDVVGKVEVLTPPKVTGPGDWKRETLGGTPELTSVEVFGVDPDNTDEVFEVVTGYLTPTTLYRGVLDAEKLEPIKQSPSFFDASHLEVHRYFANSKDGTRVPYFVVSAKELKLDGKNPTLLTGYGGFEIPLPPYYDATAGRTWVGSGGVFVVGNIRGGGEYGPKWHQAALRQNRLRAYEDFAAIAEDLVAKKITSKEHLGIIGGSNGGLLMGNMLTLYPQLFGAIVCEVPLLDMRRYTHLSAGASWIAEYGDPDKPEEWAFIQTFSPYQNVKKGTKYPPILFTTSTRDDRVGPAQARKMAAKMLDFGDDVHFYENVEGGHPGAADHKQAAFMTALAYTFLWNHLK